MSKRLLLGAITAIACLGLLPAGAAAKQKVTWLCKPGLADNPCKPGLDTTVFSPTLEQLEVERVKARKRAKFDCFYVYPTVSDQETTNADLSIDPELRSIALYQAARYSEHCRVFAPVYRQVTLTALLEGGGFTDESLEIAYRSVLTAWKTYLRKFNDGRGIVLISHSQGTGMLTRLVAERIDPKPRMRKQLISALLFGGGVTVKEGGDAGGSFKRVKACRSPRQIGCVIGFSAFNEPVPPDSIFGRAEEPGLETLCANPAALGGGTAPLNTIYPSEPFAPGTTIGLGVGAVGSPDVDASTPFYEFRGAYDGTCTRADGANVLQIADAPGAPHLNAIPSATWGLHLADANLALGNQVDLIARQAKRYLKKRR
jgi:hypothetical protein